MIALTLNAGSSSLKFALFEDGDSAGAAQALARGQVSSVSDQPVLKARRENGEPITRALDPGQTGHESAFQAVILWIREAFGGLAPDLVGHRIVHGGMDFAEPVFADEVPLERLEALAPLAPLHQPHNLAGLAAAQQSFSDARHVLCFDTAFHRGRRFEAEAFGLPRRYYEQGVRRFGFHGLAYESAARWLKREAPDLALGKVIAAQLGAGVSLCALLGLRSIATTMGFSALEGAPMATRCGRLDAGALLYLLRRDNLSADQMERLLYEESGLLGLSELSGDMRTLEASPDPRARDAIDFFVHRLVEEAAMLAANLKGLDALVLSGGIGENSPRIRAAFVNGLRWLGADLDPAANARGLSRISSDQSRVAIFVAPADEEAVIARHCFALAGNHVR